MNDSKSKDFLTSNVSFENNFLNLLFNNCKVIEVKKGVYLLREGEICKHSFYVKKGLLRQFSIDDKGKEHILQFAPENWFMADRESVFFQEPSSYFIEALENSFIVEIDDEFIKSISFQNKEFADINNKLLHNHIRHLQKRITQLLSASAEERYLEFVKMYPDLLLRVPQWMVASYLGIMPESLSRIRKDLAKKNFHN